ncbi:DUF29 domain-containing protein [Pleurocapsa sp. FMAR1]|uniref:DUF29 domain-containing protein n=1 Tax=Pleurocapsa sp. FMAR1 TaxID=3040204 RepID=UPI0029C7A042|nr:DUF29 domain-containing protein [Pleurocapsa sp. FMAR1]
MQDTKLEYDSWLSEQVKLLRTRNFEHLDINNLIEELEALGRAEKSAVKSLTYQIILHLLLIDYWSDESVYNKDHWRAEVDAFQLQLEDKLTTNLKQLIEDNLPRLYEKAKTNAARKSRLREDCFPSCCPYTLGDIEGRLDD